VAKKNKGKNKGRAKHGGGPKGGRPSGAASKSAGGSSTAVAPRGGTQKRVALGDLDGFAAERLDWPLVRALFERQCPSSLGRRLLGELQPRAADDAREALDRLRELRALPEGSSGPPLGDLTDPLPAIESAERFRRVLGPEELLGLLAFLRATERIDDWLAKHADSLPTVARLGAGLPDLTALAEVLDDGLGARGEVRDQASARLAKVRQQIRDLTQRIEKAARALANRPDLRGAFADGAAGQVSVRDGRPVLAVKAKHAGRLPGLVHDRSGSGETLFIEPRELIEQGNLLAGLKADENNEVTRLLSEWTREALLRKDDIATAAEALGQLELAVAAQRFCEVYGARPAEIAEPHEGLVLKVARHPLLAEQERTGEIDGCVPIDLRLGDAFDVLVITGPNTGGKTLALKTAGLSALLTRLGLPICADRGSRVPLFDGVVADIGDEQEVQQSLSTFSSHLKRIAEGLERAAPTVLFLLDELGGGTDPAEGAALGEAILDHLRVRRVPTLASTHIGKLKEYAFRHAQVENAACEFDVESLRPLYKLVVGTPGESRALAIAKRLGFDPKILEVAEKGVEGPRGAADAVMGEIQAARVEAERARAQSESTLNEVEDLKRQLQEAERRLEEQRGRLGDEAQIELESRASQMRPHLERLAKLTAQIGGDQKRDLEAIHTALTASLQAASVNDRRQSFLEGLKKGDLVYVPRFQKKCPILRLDRDKQRIKVRLGRQELELGLDEVSAFEAL
jgi:DNA mismatch repair protein MutS2